VRVNEFEQQIIGTGGILIELVSAVVIAYHSCWALIVLIRGEGTDRARLIIADGVLAGLGFSVAGTLLKTIALQSWPQMGIFALVFSFRTILKQVFSRERNLIQSRHYH